MGLERTRRQGVNNLMVSLLFLLKFLGISSVVGQSQFGSFPASFGFRNESSTPFDRTPEYIYRNKSLVNYMVLAPSIILPSSVYTATVTIQRASVTPLSVTLSISKDGVNFQETTKTMKEYESESFSLLVPRQLPPGDYKIRVEGNYPNTQGGSIFLHQSNLTYSERFLSILIQTNRYVFTGGQKVMFRVILLKRDLKPFEDSVDVFILDARGIVMRRWPSVASNQGIVDLTYELPEYTNLGKWKIRVRADTQIEEKVIQVEKYFQPQFEVYVSVPAFIQSKDGGISAEISGFYGSEKIVRGNGTVRLYAFEYDTPRKSYTLIDEMDLYVKGTEEVSWEMSMIYNRVGQVNNLGIRIEADILEYFIGESRLGFAESRIISDTYRVKFVNPAPPIFKPGLPFVTHLTVTYSDLEKISSEKLQSSTLRITPQVIGSEGSNLIKPIEVLPTNQDRYEEPSAYDGYLSVYSRYLENSRMKSYWEKGLIEVKVTPPKTATSIIFRAEFIDDEGNSVRTEMTAYSFFSPSSKYLSVWSTSSRVVVGEYVTLRVAATYSVKEFYYVVMAKGLIVQSGTETLANEWSLPKTFALPVSSEMAPGFRVVVYHITRGDEITSDSVFVPVDVITRHSISLNLNQNKDRLKDTLEVQMMGDPGAYFGIAAQRSVREFMQAGNELSVASVFESLYSLEPANKSYHRVTWRNRNGEQPDESVYLPAMSYGATAAKTFDASSLLVFSDSNLPGVENKGCEQGKMPCITRGCYSPGEICDGFSHCPDGTDEFLCDDVSNEEIIDFRVNRISRYMDFYDPSDGDWAWHRENLAHSADYIFVLNVPKITDTWHFNGFAVSKKSGFALLESSIVYETSRAFMLAADAPPSIRRGEQLGIVTILYNHTPKDIYVYIVLKGSEDFQFVHVKEDGNERDSVETYSFGDHQHFVWIGGNSEMELRFPIKPVIDQGTIKATITATAQMRVDTVEVEVEVLPEGVQLGKHTSMVLDLKNRALVLRFLDIFTEESPLIPYDRKRKFVYGSPAGHVTLSGDVMGPIFPSMPASMSTLLGKAGKGTADRLFDLSANVWSLHYLRLTNQLEPSFARQVFVEMNKFYAQVMKRYSPRGWFKMWNLSRPNVWLSAWALQVFHHASFQDWETYFYVEQDIFNKVAAWLLRYQNDDGSFSETKWYPAPLNKRMGIRRDMNGPYNVSLTAHVTITLHHVLRTLDGDVRSKAGIAKNLAIKYLERALNYMTDPYEIAMTAYTLTLTDSDSKETAFGLLHASRRDEGGMTYWSPGEVPRNGIIYENQRPFIQPKNNEYWDSVAVEATSFALLTYLARDGVTAIPEKIVEWLNTMRLTDGGFISTLDTIVTFEALTEYTNRARLRDITEMSVVVELGSLTNEDDIRQTYKIHPGNIKEVHTFDIAQVWGHLNILARGSGQAVIQLDTSFGVDQEEFKDTPPVEAFELKIQEFFSFERNKTALTIEACFRWILLDESPVSGSAVLEVEIPSGYGLIQSDAINLVASGVHPTLRDSYMAPGKTSWYFDYIPPEWTCFNHTVRRWQPVANLTSHRQSTIYEAYAPERFVNTIVNDTSLLYLTMCHVCGSYQCQYCPFYGGTISLKPSSSVVYYMLVLLVPYILCWWR